jgi:glycosyltransferase involved in cell wall biosynthesis
MGALRRIGLIYPSSDPASPANWSGTPHGLYNGLRSLGISVVPISNSVPRWRKVPRAVRNWVVPGKYSFHPSPGEARARSRRIAAAIAEAGQLDGIIAMGTDYYDLDLALQKYAEPVATYDDGTFALFLRYPDSAISQLNVPQGEVQAWVRLQEMACRRASIACVSTEWAKRSVVGDFGVPEERVRVVGMGHKPRSISAAERNFDAPHFLFVGIDWARKNGAAVLDAFAKVHERFPEARLAVVGDHPPLNQAGVTGYGYLARENPEAQKVLDRLFASATAFVLPSLFDPSPIAYLEAASSGLPVIATICGGAGELLGDAAINVDPHDGEALVRAMMRLADGETAREMGAKALSRSSRSTWRDVSQRIVDVMAEATEGR